MRSPHIVIEVRDGRAGVSLRLLGGRYRITPSMSRGAQSFIYDGGTVEPGETLRTRFRTSQTYLGDPVGIPVTIINGSEPGPRLVLTAAQHGDELNGIEVVRSVARRYARADLHGTLVCLPIVNALGFMTQERYLPVYDRDLNRSFPGDRRGTSARRIAHEIYQNFVVPCDVGLDFHTSTRGRTNVLHVRADMDDERTARLARGFGTNLIIGGKGPSGTLRREATVRGTPTVTVEMGQAHRFERELIEHAIGGVRSVLAEYAIHPTETVRWPGWQAIVDGTSEKAWIRADAGGIVEMYYGRGDLVDGGDPICTITNPFKDTEETVIAPFDGLLVGVLENPVVYPGNPLCHLVELDETVRRVLETRQGERA